VILMLSPHNLRRILSSAYPSILYSTYAITNVSTHHFYCVTQ
jgi:hypothetical protein